MTIAAQSMVLFEPESSAPQFAFGELCVFSTVPQHHHDVTTLLGMVLVYETDTLCLEGIKEGAYYVVEDQHPVSGMSWELYDRCNREHRPREPRVRIKTSRRIVRAVRRTQEPDLWWLALPSGFHDGPYEDWVVAGNMVGKVVGVYQPNVTPLDGADHSR
jgi:hypothetical protein